MRYRKLDAAGDYTFGNSGADFFVNSAEAVAQAVMTRLKLWRGEWFVDPRDGTPWLEQITGAHNQGVRDMAIKQRILQTPGVLAITQYHSSLDPVTRKFAVTATVRTVFGETDIIGAL
jgi:hypothetical protein